MEIGPARHTDDTQPKEIKIKDQWLDSGTTDQSPLMRFLPRQQQLYLNKISCRGTVNIKLGSNIRLMYLYITRNLDSTVVHKKKKKKKKKNSFSVHSNNSKHINQDSILSEETR